MADVSLSVLGFRRDPAPKCFNVGVLKLLISAGEASGDLHGARLLRSIAQRRPVAAFGMGGTRLATEGLEILVRSEAVSVVGISEVFEKLPALFRARRALAAEARRRAPDAAVLIDFPDFHAVLARGLDRAGVPLVYYVSPQVWAWRKGRARIIARRARRIVTLFPFEAEIYRGLGADAVCAGHPLVDDVREALASPSPLPAKTRPRLLLLPGSRTAEVRRHWAPMAGAAESLARRRGLEAVAVRAPGLPEGLYPGARERGITLAGGGAAALLASADLALVASGTATLEAALCGTPMIVLYRTSRASFAVGRLLVHVPWVSLVNILAREEVVPELLQERVTADGLVKETEALLDSPERLERMRRGLARVAKELGPPGASRRAAEAVIEAVEGGARRPERAASR